MPYNGLFHLTLQGDHAPMLRAAFKSAEEGSSSGKLCCFRKTTTGLEFYAYKLSGLDGLADLPSPISFNVACELAIEWLADPATVYPDAKYYGDGDLARGFIVTADSEKVCITPHWNIYGK